jgi:hypothetical protein
MGKVAQQVTRVEGPKGPVVAATTDVSLSGAPLSSREEAQVRKQQRQMHKAAVKHAKRMQQRAAAPVRSTTAVMRARGRVPRRRSSRPASRPQARSTDPPPPSDPPGPLRSSTGDVAGAAYACAPPSEHADAIVRAAVVRDEAVAAGQAPLARTAPSACAGGISSLDNPDTTRHPCGNPEESGNGLAPVAAHPSRLAWLGDLERATSEHRERRARGHERGARRQRDAARREGMSEAYATQQARWHRARAQGQRRRFEHVRECQQRTAMQVLCAACGALGEQSTRCRIGIVCVSCRSKRTAERRRQFGRARAVVLEQAKKRGLLHPKRPGGAYSEKLLTLTVPHVREHDVATRIGFVMGAWPYFLKALNAWLRERGAGGTEWLRHAEWTIGDDEQGHPHWHVWFFGPYLPRERLLAWWSEALVRVGFAAELGPLGQRELLGGLVVDIRAVRGGDVEDGEGIVTEVIKYMTKDIVARGTYVAPATYARVYESLDGRRPLQASRGFLALGRQEPCCMQCGAARASLVRFKDTRPAIRAAGEPEWCVWRGGIEAQRQLAERGPPSAAASVSLPSRA